MSSICTVVGENFNKEKYTSVADYYSGKSIFITGGTGFLGKMYIQKILYSCPGIEKIYMLVRASSTKAAKHRIMQMVKNSSQLFEQLKKERPVDLLKLVPIVGDISCPKLGINPDDEQLLREEVSIVVHSAATINIRDLLQDALNINVTGTQNVLALAKRMKKLQAVVHMSTTFCAMNSDSEFIEEIVYPPPINLNDIQKLQGKYGQIRHPPKSILGNKQNTYLLTKAISESMIHLNRGDLPIAIIRPSLTQDALFGRFATTSDFFRDDMWFGAVIASVPNGKTLICAPRWANPYKSTHLLANGACYIQSQRRASSLVPLKDMSGIVEYKYYPDSRSVLFGLQNITNPYYTLELGPEDYLGIFQKNGKTFYVAGAPRSKFGYGQVFIIEPPFRETEPLNIKANVSGHQLGSYFGASMVCTDINGDGVTDLLVGAPNYVIHDGQLNYDQGAVFVYLTETQESNFTLKESDSVFGSAKSGARFGSSIADLGDIDGDGYNDIAIGAPWENEGIGAVYIYRGTSKGLQTKYVQRITVENARTFGVSISKGVDITDDNCNELAVGALNSRTAYIFKCIPTMHVDVSIKVPEAMNLQQNATNFTALFCVKAPSSKLWPRVKLNFRARIAFSENRANLKDDSEYDVAIAPGDENCDERIVEIKPTADLSKPISIKFNLEVTATSGDVVPLPRAIIDENSVLHSSLDIQLTRDCGEDLICKPLLEMSLKALNSPYVPGSDEILGLNVSVLNKEEPSFGAKVHLILPFSPKRLPTECSLENLNVTCLLPAPLRRMESVVFEIELEYIYNNVDNKELKIKARLEDPMFEDSDIEKAFEELVIAVTPQASFAVSGKVLPNAIVVVTRDKFYEAENVTFVHYYEITNFGPSDWFRLSVQIILPEKVNLSSQIKECFELNGTAECEWTLPAKVSLPVVLPLRFDLQDHGHLLEENSEYNLTSTINILWETENRSTSITTTLVLEPAQPYWPVIVGCIAGLILLTVITIGFYKRLEDFQRLQEPETEAADTPIEAENSSQELITDESD